MVVNKRSRQSRKQGSGTHGWGRNKHRGSGSTGGFGNAGTGKKAHGKKPSIWALDYFGKHGFSSKSRTHVSAITIKDVDQKLPGWVAKKQASQEGGVVVVDLGKLGYNKLIGTGRISRKAKITVKKSSAGASEKIKAAGGELIIQ